MRYSIVVSVTASTRWTDGDEIRARRTALGLTQRDLARTVGVTPGTLLRIEQGTYEASVSTLYLIARALDVTMETLVHDPRTEQVAS